VLAEALLNFRPIGIMLLCIMRFLNRVQEMARLDHLMARRGGGLVVVYGRRRLGKTRLLLEWTARHGGLYTVADLSSADVQRRYFARSVATRLPGFADVEYPDWRSLLSRLAREARLARWRGPLVFDELPYLVLSSPELPSILQQWNDHEARDMRLVVALAGSSQRMMQGLVLSAADPLYGRATEILELQPLDGSYLGAAFGRLTPAALVESYAAWGGVPRYWELAVEERGTPISRVERIVLDPLGPLHREPDRILIEEVPSALEVRPVLDAIGAGAHRVSEIAARIGRPATSISRPLERLLGMGLVRREIPFAEPEKKSRRSLYKIDDPFFRLWFRVVAPYRGVLASSGRPARVELLTRFWPQLVSMAWEDLCRKRLPFLHPRTPLGELGPWRPPSRWWRGEMPEWDIVAESAAGRRLLLGECRWSSRLLTPASTEKLAREVFSRAFPALPESYRGHEIVRSLLVPALAPGTARSVRGVIVGTASDVLAQAHAHDRTRT
jgi:AAA+ ATPase superfamily predicted ATPase